MDIVKCATASVAETALLRKAGYIKPQNLVSRTALLLILQYIALKLFYILIWPFYFSPLRHVPGPRGGNLLFGQVFNQAQALPSEIEKSWMRANPDVPFIRFLSLLNTEFLMVNNVRAHKEVLQTQCYSFVKPAYYERVIAEIAGRGILFMEGEEHKRQRKLLVAPFSFGNVKRLLPFFQIKAQETSSIIRKQLESGTSDIVEVSGLLAKTTLDIVGLAALGYELNSLSTSSPLAKCYERVFECATPAQIMINIVHRYIPIRQWLPLKANKNFVESNETVRRILREHIRMRRTEFRDGKVRGEKASRDLLTLMIEESKDTLSEDEILGYLLNFMSAGHETTAGALTWALYALTLYPQMQKRLRDEILSRKTSHPLSYADVEGMRFLNNFTKEVLRYYPPAPSFPREAAEVVEIEGVRIPKGTLLWIAPAAPQFNEQIWGPTANQFDPDRYDALPDAATDPYASQAFSTGPRICIGKSFALLEFKVIIVELIRNFAFENTGLVEPQKSGPSLRPLNGMNLRVTAVELSDMHSCSQLSPQSVDTVVEAE